jgi:hypothetical protein
VRSGFCVADWLQVDQPHDFRDLCRAELERDIGSVLREGRRYRSKPMAVRADRFVVVALSSVPAWPRLPGNEKPIVRPCWLGTVQTHRPYPVKGAANLSLSIFTIEVDGKPVLAFGARRYSEAQAICTDEQLRTKLSSLKSDTVPLCGDNAILRARPPRGSRSL